MEDFMEDFFKKLNHRKKWFVGGVIIALVIIGVLVWQAKEGIKLITGLVGTESQATLILSPETGSYKVGESFRVDILLNTANKNVVAAGVYLNYDSDVFEVTSIDTSDSVFNPGNQSQCMYQGKPCEIVNHYVGAGRGEIEIIKGEPTPGIKTSNGRVAMIYLKGKKAVSPTQDNFTFDFSGSYQGKSRVIVDDGQGTDILSGVKNGRYTFTTTSQVPVAPSNLTATAVSSSQIRLNWQDNSSNETGFKVERSSPDNKNWSQVALITTANTTTYTDPLLTPNTTYYYRIRAYNTTGNSGYSNEANAKTFTGAAVDVDINDDGLVNFDDVTRFAVRYPNERNTCTTNCSCDVDKNGKVDFDDVVKFAVEYPKQRQQ